MKGKMMARQLQDQRSSADKSGDSDVGAGLADFAAELTEAAYPVALRHGLRRDWLEFELELWNVMTQTVKKWEMRSLLPLA
jgi:hypothetical protein